MLNKHGIKIIIFLKKITYVITKVTPILSNEEGVVGGEMRKSTFDAEQFAVPV